MKKFTHSIQAGIILSLALAGSVCSAEPSKLSSGDETFVKYAVQSGSSEVETAKLATKQAGTEAVRDYAGKVAKDRSLAVAEVQKIASEAGFKVKAEGGTMHDIQLARMKKLTGNEFDQAFLKQMESDHTRALTAYQKEAKDGENAPLKAFAGKHVESIEALLHDSGTLKARAQREPEARK